MNRERLAILVLLLLGLLTPLASASLGAADISLGQVLQVLGRQLAGVLPSGLGYLMADPMPDPMPDPLVDRIVLELRLPRILLALFAGAGLALCGSVLQTVTRNPLADPYLFGISSGASFGAVVTLTLMSGGGAGLLLDTSGSGLFSDPASWGSGLFSDPASWSSGLFSYFSGQLSLPLGAFIGACLSVLLVMGLSGLGLGSQVERMLLSGVATSFLFGSLGSLLLYFSSPQATASVLFWSLGSFAKASWGGLWLPGAVVGLSLVIITALKRQIQALQAGDETAHTLGVRVARLRLGTLLLCSLVTAVLVASCGGIGFVGLMIPHTVRLLFPARQSVWLVALCGGLFMVWVDVLARCLLGNQELPVGIITAAIGSGFFLVVLRRRR